MAQGQEESPYTVPNLRQALLYVIQAYTSQLHTILGCRHLPCLLVGQHSSHHACSCQLLVLYGLVGVLHAHC